MGFESQAEMLEALGKSYLETKRLVGAKAPARPAQDAPAEEWSKWRKLVGAPDDPAGYGETLRPPDFPEDLWGKELETNFRALAHKHNLTPEAAKEIAALHASVVSQGLEQNDEQIAQARQQEAQALRGKWGPEFAQNIHEAGTFATTIGLSKDDPIFHEAKYVEAMFAAARLIGEKSLPVGKVQSASGGTEIWMRQVMDPTNTSDDARAYRGEFGQDRQIEVANRWAKAHESLESQGITYR